MTKSLRSLKQNRVLGDTRKGRILGERGHQHPTAALGSPEQDPREAPHALATRPPTLSVTLPTSPDHQAKSQQLSDPQDENYFTACLPVDP